MTRRTLVRAIAPSLAVAAVMGSWGFIGCSGDAPVRETVRVARGDLVEVADASGRIEPYRQVEVKSLVSGEVIEVLVEEGDTVEEGQLLVRLDPTAYDLALRDARASLGRLRASLSESQASLRMARAEAEEAAANHELQVRGVELGVAASETQRTARSSASVAEASVSVRRAQVRGQRASIESAQVQLENAQRQRNQTEIHAPFAGTVLSVDVEDGLIVASALTNVAGGTPLATLADLSALRVIGELDEAQIGRVAVGQEVIIRVDAHPNRSFTGEVSRVSPLGVEESNVVTFDVEIEVTDDGAGLLRSGMSADLEIVTARRQGVLRVPLVAVQSQGRSRFVRLAAGELQEIRTGANDGTHLEILSGVEEGDELLTGAATERERSSRGSGMFRPPGGGGGQGR